MDWWQVVTVCLTTVGATWYFRRESADETKLLRRDLIDVMKELKNETKDFHGRLCTLEERYIQMMQRILEKK